MCKALLLTLIFLSAVSLSTAQDEPKYSISEINALLPKSKADTFRVNLLCEAALVYIWRPGMKKTDFDSAQYFINRAIDLCSQLNNAVCFARCYRVSSQLYRENNAFGMNLIRGLAAQLEGTIHIISEKGLQILIEFPLRKIMNADNEHTILTNL